VLNVLVARAGQPVSKEDLFAFVWNDTAVSDDALTSCVQELRRARSNGRNGAWLSIPDDMGTLVNAACLRARMGLRDEPRFKKLLANLK
jgi:hypothetical protein